MPTDAEVAIESGASSVLASLEAMSRTMSVKAGGSDSDPAGACAASAFPLLDHGDSDTGSQEAIRPPEQVATPSSLLS